MFYKQHVSKPRGNKTNQKRPTMQCKVDKDSWYILEKYEMMSFLGYVTLKATLELPSSPHCFTSERATQTGPIQLHTYLC